MYLKIKDIKDMKDVKLVLDLTNGSYAIGIQFPALKIGNGNYDPMLTEIMEEYYSMDYKIEEVVERFDKIYEVLNPSESEKTF
ncbi:MAG: hypothetical protein E6356_14030 [Terrisporobacter othiniensis]|nr:hypothetical protein [Terrisporobacter othiniensis]